MHESGMHPDLFGKFGFIVKAAGNTMIIGLGEDLCIPVFCNLLEQARASGLHFSSLFDNGTG